MRKTALPLISVFILTFAVINPCFAATVSSSQSIEQKLGAHEDISQDTVVAPLLMSATGPAMPVSGDGVSLFKVTENVGFLGDIRYQIVTDEGIRIQYSNLTDEAAFFWLFDEPVNISNLWVRIRYSGQAVPSVVGLVFDDYESRQDSGYGVYLDNGLHESSVFFKVPAKEAFETVETMRLEIDPSMIDQPFADFVIHGVEVMPEGFDPSSGYESNVSEFDWYRNPFETQNSVSLNTQPSN